MNALRCACCALLLAVVPSTYAADAATAADLQRAVPVAAHLVIEAWHNPERDYQAVYLQDVWKTVENEKLIERISELITKQVPDQDLKNAKSIFGEIREAAAPIDWKAVSNFREMIYAQVMDPPFTHHLVLLKLTPEEAVEAEKGVKNLLDLMVQKSEGKLSLKTSTEDSVEVTTLDVPPEMPMRITVAHVDDVLVVSSSEELAKRSVGMLRGSNEPSKFDDQRLTDALKTLPKPEDVLVFFDGRQLFAQMTKIGAFIRSKSEGKPEADRVATLIEKVMNELSVLDYEVTVSYTDGYRNCATTAGKLMPDSDQKLLGKMIMGGEPFKDWERWIPADALSYSLSTGANLHPAYEGVMKILREQIPESKEDLDKFEQSQDQIGVHLDDDILQAFSGESVSLTLPADSAAAAAGPDSVFAMRCQKPERIRELLHKLVEGLQQFPAVQAQQLSLTECEELEGFDEFSAMSLAMVGKAPVIGFHEGWMMIGSSSAAVQKVLDTLDGKGPTITGAESYKRFDLDIEGPVTGLSYRHLADSTRQTAESLRQVGLMAPMILGMAGAQTEPEDLKPIQEALELLPSIANVVDKFDYLEAMLSVTQQGEQPNSYERRSVTLVRPPAELDSEAKATDDSTDEPSEE